jgi:hypothetical protein
VACKITAPATPAAPTLPFIGLCRLTTTGAWCFVPDNGQYFYFSTNGGKIIKIKLDEAGNMTDFVRVDPIGPAEEDYLFINPFMMDPVKNEVLYVPTAHPDLGKLRH